MATPALRLIAHLDMDAFYASVELLRYPELRGLPVVIGGGRRHQPEEAVDPGTGRVTRRFATMRGYAGRGVVTTATYEARAFGIHSAQGLMKAAALAPDAILLPMDFDAYRKYSRLFKAAVARIAPRIEDRGIDEIYIDVTDVRPPGADGYPVAAAVDDTGDAVNVDVPPPVAAEAWGEGAESETDAWWRARDVAKALKGAVRDATGLSCSIAVAPNKLLAKIASELDKPDGLTLLRPGDIPTRIWPLPPKRINGVGPKASARLDALGITTIGALAQADLAWLIEHFGRNYGAWLANVAHGRDERDVVTDSEPKSISRETTFERDLSVRRDRDELSRIFTDLCVKLAGDLQRKGYAGRTIGIKLRFDNFATVTRDQTIPAPTQDAQAIRRAAGECLKRIDLERRIRLLGVRIGSLSPVSGATPSTIRSG
ncbi:MAG: DNA polymerase IV [Betaproteobacteria bacterium]